MHLGRVLNVASSSLYILPAVAGLDSRSAPVSPAARVLSPRENTPQVVGTWPDDDDEVNYCEYQPLKWLGMNLGIAVRVRFTMADLASRTRRCPAGLAEAIATECTPPAATPRSSTGQSFFATGDEVFDVENPLAMPRYPTSKGCLYRVLFQEMTDKSCIERVVNCLMRKGTKPVHCWYVKRPLLEELGHWLKQSAGLAPGVLLLPLQYIRQKLGL